MRRLLIGGALVSALAIFAQNTPRFVRASVTPTDERVHHLGEGPFVVSGQRIEARSIPVGALVTESWHLPAYQVIWPVQSLGDTYNVLATMPKGTTPEQRSLMFQQLLAERFGFRYHREPKDIAVYALEIAPGGLKMRPAAPPPTSSLIGVTDKNNTWHMFRLARPPSPGESASQVPQLNVYSIDELLSILRASMFGRNEQPAINQTGLHGYFSFDLRVPCPADGCRMKEWSDAVFFDLLEKQLGLRGVKKTVAMNLMVIDHVEFVPAGK